MLETQLIVKSFILSKAYSSKAVVSLRYPTNSGFSFEERKVQTSGIWWGAEKLAVGAMKSTALKMDLSSGSQGLGTATLPPILVFPSL